MIIIFGFCVVMILLGINGIFYYAGYTCFKTVVNRDVDLSWRLFNVCYCLMSFGVAGAISVGIITLVFIK